MAKLTQEQRDRMPSKLYALPSKKKFPINDITHCKLAWDMVDRAKGLTEEEREEARRNILKRAKELGIDTSNWNKKKLKAEGAETEVETIETLALHAAGSNILLDDLEHPNKMPFRGILTYFDVPSDRAPGGANGMKVVIPSEVGIPALSSLKGMAVNYEDGWGGHDPTNKIGVITDAYTGDPQEDGAVPVYIQGYIYAHDFADAAFEIKANQSMLGFSYETALTRLEPGIYNGEEVLYVRELGYFTGASILLKASAAYQKTAIAAKAEEEGGMNVEEFKELLASAMEDLKRYVDAKLGELEAAGKGKGVNKDMEINEKTKKQPEAKVEKEDDAENGDEDETKTKAKLDAEDAEDEEDGGADEAEEEADGKGKAKGKGKSVKASAEESAETSLEASADLLEELKALRQELAELKASKAESEGDVPPERKSVAFPRTLMAKYSVDEEGDFEKAMKAISERKDLDVEQRMALKFELMDKMRRQQQQ